MISIVGNDKLAVTIENFIKAGAFDCLGGTRKQFMMVYPQIMDAANQERKSSMTGQMTLFDLFSEEEKKENQRLLSSYFRRSRSIL